MNTPGVDLGSIITESAETNNEKPRSIWGLTALGVTAGAVVALCIGAAPFISPALRKFCLPFIPATEAQVRNVISALPHRGGKLADIGSGDGRIVLEAARNGFTASGYELNPWLVFYSKVKAFRLGLSSKATFVRRDLWKTDFQKYENVVIFGVDQMMPRLEEKLAQELHLGSHVVACRFRFPNWKPVKVIGHGIDKVWLYNIPQSFTDLSVGKSTNH
uniref:ATP synthase subunit C lysine N-methyltransferase-like isoform X1 n=1 Tax=Styela clava TaxID=7725 RepID=UPI00193AC88D|nr:ATP synthase subunit C lysine N-methyltransferase-like isoform X1 [Styela clava]